jgi:DNA primase large subunit
MEKNLIEIPETDALTQVLSTHAALAISALSESPRMIRRVTESIFVDTIKRLSKMSTDVLANISKTLGVDLKRANVMLNWLVDDKGKLIPLKLEFYLDLDKYLKITSASNSPELFLTNSFVRDGRVYLDRSRLVQLLAYAVRERVLRTIESYRNLENETLREKGLKLAARFEAGERRRVRYDALPDCIERILKKGVRTDEEAYMIISFLLSVKPSRDDVEKFVLKSKLSSTLALENLVDAILGLQKTFTPYRCGSKGYERACGLECEKGVLEEYYERVKKRSGAGSGFKRGRIS